MLAFVRHFLMVRKMAKLARVVQLAKRTDEILIGTPLPPDTRLLLQEKRDELESQIRVVQAA